MALRDKDRVVLKLEAIRHLNVDGVGGGGVAKQALGRKLEQLGDRGR
jgi:hypothetical protein